MYKNGLAGLAVNYVEARKIFLKVAEQKAYLKYSVAVTVANLGVAEAENELGMFYQRGMGVDVVLVFTLLLQFEFKFDFET